MTTDEKILERLEALEAALGKTPPSEPDADTAKITASIGQLIDRALEDREQAAANSQPRTEEEYRMQEGQAILAEMKRKGIIPADPEEPS